jgi:MFS family permease
MVFLNMGVMSTAFSVYFPYLREMRGLTNTQVSLLSTIRYISSLFVMAFSDRYYRKLDIRKGVALTCINSVGAYLVYAFAAALPMYYLASLMFGISYGLGAMIPASILIRRWYPEDSGLPLGFAAAGSGIAITILPLIARKTVESYGLTESFFIVAVIIAVISLPMVLLIRNRPASSGIPEQGSGTQQTKTADVSRAGTNFQLMMLTVAMLMNGVVGLTACQSKSLLYRMTNHEMAVVTSAISFGGFVLIFSKILFGKMADRFGARLTMILFLSLVILSLFMMTLSQDAPDWHLYLTEFVYSVGAPVATVGISVLAAEFSTQEQYVRLLKNSQFNYTLGALLSSVIPGIIADRTGSYIPAYRVIMCCGMVFMAAVILMYRDRDRKNAGK